MEKSNMLQTQTEILSTLHAVEIIDKCYATDELSEPRKMVEVKNSDQVEAAKIFIANHFGVTPLQALFLTVIFILTNDTDDQFSAVYEASLRQISRKLNMKTSELFKYLGDFDDMIGRGILTTDDEINKTRQCLKITSEVSEAIMLNTPFVESGNRESGNRLSEYLKNQKEQIIKCSRGIFSANALVKYVEDKYNTLAEQFPLVKYINDLPVSTKEKLLFFEVCGSTTFNRGKIKVIDFVDIMCKDSREKKFFLQNLSTGESLLIKEDLLDIESAEFLNELEVSLTEKALEMYLGEEVELYSKKIKDSGITAAEDIIPKELYFSRECQEQLSEFESLLKPENFPMLQERLKGKGMPVGLTAILYGGPGTGKTESVMQIARKSRRKIVRVDIASVKSMWMGESEKLIKKIFVNYNALVKREKICPILLFNEADAILLKRKTGDLRGAENALNAMQNIILEEMENFPGILVATTNLIGNLDAAFERRFLFKIKMDNPTPQVKQKIWADRLPYFTESDFKEIATNYDFSGGEIDNIVRKLSMSEIIEGTVPTLEKLERLCFQEKFHRNNRHPIGYKQSE
ncbi:MAG: AAA family ATPase [Prolixibacteraceae bacterium]